jgi:D-lactate dehydrogenase (cytochrome)
MSNPSPGRPQMPKAHQTALMAALVDIVGDRVVDSQIVRDQHSQDEAFHHAAPDLVVFPLSTAEVSAIVRACARFESPITPWGAGTSLEANALAVQGGVSLNLSRMDKLLQINVQDHTVCVEAGIRRQALDRALKGTGLFFPVDPGADATIGGMAATRASGTTSVKYGTMRSNVLACTVVLASGETISTGTAAPKSAAGYDLTALMVGSEGTLGIMTALTLRLHPVPEAFSSLVCTFPSIDAAVDCVAVTIQCGTDVARIELLDAAMMRAINAYHKSDYLVAATLFVEFHGSELAVREQALAFENIIVERGGKVAARAALTEERTALWHARHTALWATKALSPGKKVLITDVCIPISRLAECIESTRAEMDRSILDGTIAGHVGDGNFHAFLLIDPANPAEIEAAETLHHDMAIRAIEMGGTCTGEHGIGIGKRKLMKRERGGAVETMYLIKGALDPSGILNPGKLFL